MSRPASATSDLGIAEQPGYLRDRQRAIAKITIGKRRARARQYGDERRTFARQSSGQCQRAQASFAATTSWRAWPCGNRVAIAVGDK
jgi:hypothetical protein